MTALPPSCTAQCREGWHLDREPDLEPDQATDDQQWWIENRAEVQARRDHAAASGEGTGDLDEIRQRTRSDQEYPDLGQLIAWDMRWRQTSILVEEEHGGAGCHVTPASQDGAELIIASLARRYWYGPPSRTSISPTSARPTYGAGARSGS